MQRALSAAIATLTCLTACTPAPHPAALQLAPNFVLAQAPDAAGMRVPTTTAATRSRPVVDHPAPIPAGPARPKAAAPGPEVAYGGWDPAPPQNPGSFKGKVLAVGAAVPLPGATVATTDGRKATSGADGAFELPGGFPADGVLIASKPGYVASVTGGLAADPALELQLAPQAGLDADPPRLDGRPIVVGGQVLAPDGSPAVDAVVVLADARGALSEAASTGADGLFRMQVDAPGARVLDGTLLAALPGPAPALGVLTGVNVDRVTPRVPEVQLVAATHPLLAQIDATALGLPATVGVTMVAEDGTKLGLGAIADGVAVADLPGVRYALRAEVTAPEAGLHAVVSIDPVAIDYTAPDTTVTSAFLAAPVPAGQLLPGSPIAFQPVAGADGYQIRLAGLAGQGYVFEGFTPTPGLPWPALGQLAPGPYGLSLIAWAGGGFATRSVAAVTPRRRLETAGDGTYRWSARQVSVTP